MGKLNIAELLKDCPSGTKLYSTIHGEVELVDIYHNLIRCKFSHGICFVSFHSDGRWVEHIGECVIFPSKDQRDWSKFHKPFKDGDIVTCKGGSALIACIYKERRNTASFNHYIALYKGGLGIVTNGEIALPDDDLCFAAEEEKQQLFDIIKSNGYKWNPKTKTLEKLIVPKFKKGDKIRVKNRVSKPRIIKDVCDTFYTLVPVGKIAFTDQNNWELAPNKFDITTLKPFDKVLVRNTYNQLWIADLFSYISKSGRFVCVVHNTYQCIPYESNEHLLGTTNDCDDYYKTWK